MHSDRVVVQLDVHLDAVLVVDWLVLLGFRLLV